MKNRHIEALRKKSKRYLRERSRRYASYSLSVYGVSAPDREIDPDTEYVAFQVNDYVVSVDWEHPRVRYQRQARKLAIAACEHLDRQESGELFIGGEPVYAKLGRSRKKMAMIKGGRLNVDHDYHEVVDQKEQEILADSDSGIVITTGFDAQWTDAAKYISLCAPLSMRTPADLAKLAELVKRLMRRETTLAEAFPGYRYNAQDWMKDRHEAQQQPCCQNWRPERIA